MFVLYVYVLRIINRALMLNSLRRDTPELETIVQVSPLACCLKSADKVWIFSNVIQYILFLTITYNGLKFKTA